MATLVTIPNKVELKDSTISSQENMEPNDTTAIKGALDRVLSTQGNKKSENVLDIVNDNALVQLKSFEDGSSLLETVETRNSQQVAKIPIKPIEIEKEEQGLVKESRQDQGRRAISQQEQQKHESEEQQQLPQQQGQEKAAGAT